MLPQGYRECYDQIAEDFKGYTSTETHHIRSLCDLAFQMQNIPYEKSRILDVGCGSGVGVDWFKHHPIYALDISKVNLDQVRDHHKRIQADAQILPFKSSSFDVVICTDVFEHVPDSHALADELMRVVRPGGYVMFSCPFEQDLAVYAMAEYKKKYKYVHLRSVSWQDLIDHFDRVHFIATTWVKTHMDRQNLKKYKIVFTVMRRYV